MCSCCYCVVERKLNNILFKGDEVETYKVHCTVAMLYVCVCAHTLLSLISNVLIGNNYVLIYFNFQFSKIAEKRREESEKKSQQPMTMTMTTTTIKCALVLVLCTNNIVYVLFPFSSSSYCRFVFAIVNLSQSVDFSQLQQQRQRITMTTTNDFNFTFDYSLMHVIQYITPISKEFLRFHCCFFAAAAVAAVVVVCFAHNIQMEKHIATVLPLLLCVCVGKQ